MEKGEKIIQIAAADREGEFSKYSIIHGLSNKGNLYRLEYDMGRGNRWEPVSMVEDAKVAQE
jgi:hypothetical protein